VIYFALRDWVLLILLIKKEKIVNEIDQVIIKAIETQVYKLSKEDQKRFDYCVKEIEYLLFTFEMAAQLAVAITGAKLAAEEN
jgi:hypothetical protein